MRRFVCCLSLLLTTVVVASCGDSTSSSARATTTTAARAASDTTTTTTEAITTAEAPDPCTLIAKADAEKIVAVALSDGTKSGSGDDVMCQYGSDPNGPTAQVEVFVGAGAKKQLDIDRDTLQHPFTTLSGIGDEAYLEAGDVFVRKGTTWVSVDIVALDPPAQQIQDGLTSLATSLATKL